VGSGGGNIDTLAGRGWLNFLLRPSKAKQTCAPEGTPRSCVAEIVSTRHSGICGGVGGVDVHIGVALSSFSAVDGRSRGVCVAEWVWTCISDDGL